MNQTVILAIEELGELNVAALRTKYRQVLGEESKSFNKQFLLRRIAWRLQANAEGDLSERARHRAAAIIQKRVALRLRKVKRGLIGERR